ncbi:polysaccharide pyruvyl transferase family protein [Romeria aff. gracilis LEGE 07310]|uniref:Polysaccharide pyruvyl transferase family protein n=1 Tax=Vasconcelosia minhoensis LEGE 07310 TaxID=915328 RepID=A0A8J7ADN7_9CYAN|nr:polysaccharide pyruvyl transferase family protein [Romeria gracilis]MBE9078026.1 polysaccharide pyruvyl transferase family protein [Romeria aff. gracilis LEGE 07310]
MQIYYYQRRDRQPNFGDELNTWLWPQLLPGYFDDDPNSIFIGTGTLLNNLFPERVSAAEKVVIFSTGAGYEQPLQVIPPHWQICCVRGPLSAQQLGLPSSKAIADGGILVRLLVQPTTEKQYPYSFMPHIHHADFAQSAWQRICQAAGICYVDPRSPVEEILQTINQTEVLLAEAMHGAIAADALRVPWIPIVTSPRILPFKWQDWCASMGLTYRPQTLPPLVDYPRWGRGLRSGGQSARHWQRSLVQSPVAIAQYGLSPNEAQFAKIISQIAETAAPCLSSDAIITERTEQLKARLSAIPNPNG